MAWIGLSDAGGCVFNPAGLTAGEMPEGQGATQRQMPQGTIMLETRLSPDGRLQSLMSHRRSHPWHSGFSLHSLPDGGLAVASSLGDHVAHGVLHHDGAGRTDVLRISYSWNAPEGWGRLTVERPEGPSCVTITLKAPPPMMMEDLHHMLRDPLRRSMDADVIFAALSDRIEPVGPTPTLSLATPVAAAGGYRTASTLQRGDLVYTPSGDLVPVLQTVRRTVPARGNFAPVRLRAPYFGLQQDIIVGPEQRLMISGSEVEYLFGAEAALASAGHMINGVSAMRCDAHILVSYVQVVLPKHEAVLAAGCAVESLYIGRLRRDPAGLAASILCDVPRGALPEHARASYPVLKHFEAVTLADHRAA